MSRKGPTKLRKLLPDTLYNSILVSRIINRSIKDGKKEPATKQIYHALELIKKELKQDPLVALEQALENIKPKIEVRPRRIGGAVYQVPTPIRSHRQNSLAIRWLINFSRKKPNKQYHTFAEKIATEIIDAYNKEGACMTKRSEVERMAEANKAFAHLRW